MHKVGIHLANGDADHGSVIHEIGAGCYTLLHHQIHLLRNMPPGAFSLVRYYLPNWLDVDPAGWARECSSIYDTHKQWTRHITWANEQNLGDESGGLIGATPHRRATRRDYEVIAEWNLKFIREFKRLQPDAILHYPAMAAGHSDDQNDYGFIGLDICREGIDLCDILDVHCYPTLGITVEDIHRGAARVHLVRALFPHKKLFISECGNFRVDEPNTPAHYEAMCWYWNQFDWILGWTFFIAADPTRAHQQNDMSRNPEILSTLARIAKSNLAPREPFSVIVRPKGVNVGPGFLKARNYTGHFREDEVYHFPGTDTEVSLAVAADGFAVWNPRTNETIVIRWDKSIYADGGNDGDGRFRKLR